MATLPHAHLFTHTKNEAIEAWKALRRVLTRDVDARLAFLKPNSRNLAFFKVVWHEKIVFGIFWNF